MNKTIYFIFAGSLFLHFFPSQAMVINSVLEPLETMTWIYACIIGLVFYLFCDFVLIKSFNKLLSKPNILGRVLLIVASVLISNYGFRTLNYKLDTSKITLRDLVIISTQQDTDIITIKNSRNSGYSTVRIDNGYFIVVTHWDGSGPLRIPVSENVFDNAKKGMNLSVHTKEGFFGLQHLCEQPVLKY